MTEKEIDIRDFNEAMPEIIKYMDYLPDDDQTRLNLLYAFIGKAAGG